MAKTVHAYIVTRTTTLPGCGVVYLAEAQVRVGTGHRWHRHDEVQVLWVRSGTLAMRFAEEEDEPDEARVGEAWVLPAGLPHAVSPSRRGTNVAQVVDLRIVDDPANPLCRHVHALGPARRVTASAPAVERACQRLDTATALVGPARQAVLMSVIWELIATLQPTSDAVVDSSTVTTARPVPSPRDPRVDAAEVFCRHQLSSPISVSAIAAAVGLSRSQVSRLFLTTCGVGPAERVRQLRVELARRLLAETTLSVKEIAHACGFVRANHFGRVFQEITGTTPSAFRAGRDATASASDK
jgi:AraC-like DNA-binding protein/uncharacterized RmlC-like cupin family protein